MTLHYEAHNFSLSFFHINTDQYKTPDLTGCKGNTMFSLNFLFLFICLFVCKGFKPISS